MAEREAGAEEFAHGLPSSAARHRPAAPAATASILTMRRRSLARTRACADGFWCLVPARRRSVSITAAITATVRITAATSNGSRNSVNSARASQAVLATPVGRRIGGERRGDAAP